MNITFIELVLFVLAVWRLSNLIVHEEGPFLMFARLRKSASRSRARWVRRFGLVQLLNCEYCVSVWFGLVLTLGYLALGSLLLWAIFPLALSAGAVLFKHVVFTIKSIDTRYDQMNQEYLKQEETLKRLSEYRQHGGVDWGKDALFEKNILERKEEVSYE